MVFNFNTLKDNFNSFFLILSNKLVYISSFKFYFYSPIEEKEEALRGFYLYNKGKNVLFSSVHQHFTFFVYLKKYYSKKNND